MHIDAMLLRQHEQWKYLAHELWDAYYDELREINRVAQDNTVDGLVFYPPLDNA